MDGEQIFYDIYSQDEKDANPAKEDTGTNAMIEGFQGLTHGFGLGQGTVAEGWLDHAVDFWKDNMR